MVEAAGLGESSCSGKRGPKASVGVCVNRKSSALKVRRSEDAHQVFDVVSPQFDCSETILLYL